MRIQIKSCLILPSFNQIASLSEQDGKKTGILLEIFMANNGAVESNYLAKEAKVQKAAVF